MERMKEMFNLQNKLNIATCGDNWKSGETEEGKQISWNMCIYMEAVEAIDSFQWKHWKDINAEPDWKNLKVELVDIWHFLMSEIMRLDAVSIIKDLDFMEPQQDQKINTIIMHLEKMITIAISQRSKGDYDITELTHLFFELLSDVGMSIDDLYVNYVVKNQLNVFRQNNGYKDGTYEKVWDSVEDNMVALHIMEEDPMQSPFTFYEALDREYRYLNSDTVDNETPCAFGDCDEDEQVSTTDTDENDALSAKESQPVS